MIWFFVTATFIIFLIYHYLFNSEDYWEKYGIPHEKSLPIVGNLGKFIVKKCHITEIYDHLYKLHPNERYTGMHQFANPALLLRDLDLIKQIAVKDFDHFVDHRPFIRNKSDRLMKRILVNLTGQEWREMRSTLSPAFTSAKMRNMFTFMSECADNFTKFYSKQNQSLIEVQMKDIFSKFTTDVLASTTFGLRCDSLEDPQNEFITTSKDLMRFGFKQNLKVILGSTLPKLSDFLNLQIVSEKVKNFFDHLIHDAIAYREENHIIRPDLIHLLMQAKKGTLKHETTQDVDAGFAIVQESDVGKKEDNKKKHLSDDDITAQALLFFFAGFDTTSTTIGFVAYELVVNPDVQSKLQKEIDEVFRNCKDAKLEYEVVLKMKYLDQVVSETLRKWSPGFMTDRLCVKDYTIEASTPEEKPLIVKKGVQVIIPILATHHNPTYFPNPDKFDPERFNEENKHKIVPGSYMPFGVGPRNCIGSRFALLVVKCVIVHLLGKFDLVSTNKIRIPFKPSPMQLRVHTEDMCLGLKPRKSPM